MKKSLFQIILLSAALTFASCGDDDAPGASNTTTSGTTSGTTTNGTTAGTTTQGTTSGTTTNGTTSGTTSGSTAGTTSSSTSGTTSNTTSNTSSGTNSNTFSIGGTSYTPDFVTCGGTSMYVVAAVSLSNDSFIKVAFASQPAAGTYTVLGQPAQGQQLSVGPGQAYIEADNSPTVTHGSSGGGQVTVTIIGGKVKATFSNIPMKAYTSNNTTSVSGSFTCD